MTVIMSVPDDGYSRNPSCVLNDIYIFTRCEKKIKAVIANNFHQYEQTNN